MIDLSTVLGPVPAPDPDSDIARLMAERNVTLDRSHWRVFGTRDLAHKVAAALPPPPVELDCSRVLVASTPFLDELLTLRPDVTLRMMDEDVRCSLELVLERRR